jgi:hypothetical protein
MPHEAMSMNMAIGAWAADCPNIMRAMSLLSSGGGRCARALPFSFSASYTRLLLSSVLGLCAARLERAGRR